MPEEVKLRETVNCQYCKKTIKIGEPCYIHEYGSIYCRPTCLLYGGFYGHFKAKELSVRDIDNQ